MDNVLDEILDFKKFFMKLVSNWYLFVISLLIAFVIAFLYNRYSKELFSVETSIIIKENNSLPTTDIFYDKLSASKESLENKELQIKAYPLIKKTLEDLNFDISYFIEGNIKTTESYYTPIKLICNEAQALSGNKIKISVIDDNSFSIYNFSTEKSEIQRFNERFLFNNINVIVQHNTNNIVKNWEEYPVVIVKFHDIQALALNYQQKLIVNQKEKGSTIISISMLTEDEHKGVVFLEKLVENLKQQEINDKNTSSLKTANFIKNKLVAMRDSLDDSEQKIQDYKQSKKITDLSLKAQSISANIASIETELAKSNSINSYYDYLDNYLQKGEGLENLSVPTSFSDNDANLNSLILQLVDIQIKKNILIDGGQINNPSISQYNRQIKQLTLNLREAIKTSKKTNNLLINDYKRRIIKMEKSLAGIPAVERGLLNHERLQSISENIYVFLLQKKHEAEITAAGAEPDIQVLSPAVYFNKSPIFPKKKKSYLIALLLGLLIPILFLLIRELIDDTLLTRTELEKITKIPFLGIIGKNYSNYNLLSNQSPKSAVYEGFRALRSNLNFFNVNHEKKVYLVTSSVSGEGKTYIAANLGIVFAKSGKKTLVIGADLRKPKLYAAFGFENKQGISNHILSDLSLSEAILKSDVNNLDVLIAGPIPANPSDALLKENFSIMIDKLKQKYDIIIFDTPPLGLVADALTLMKYSDLNIYVTRQNYTKKGLLTYVNDMYEKERLGEIHLVFNDVKEGSGAYGYGYGSGYGYGYGYGSGYGYGYGYGYTKNNDYFDDND